MKFHSSYFLFMALALTSCLDKTDVEQLYDETYSPQFITDDHTTPTITTTATSASFSPSVRYEAKIRQIYCTIGQDADSVGRRLGRTFVMLTEGERKPIGELFIDSLQPQTHYYCNVVIQDPSGRLYPGMSRDFETLPFEMTLNEPLIKQLYIRYANVGRNSKIGYSIGYRPDLADAISCHKPAIDRYYVDATRFDYQVDLSSMLPNVTLYVQPWVEQGGRVYRGAIKTWDNYRFAYKARAEAGADKATVFLSSDFDYSDISARNFKIGFYLSEHPNVEENLGVRYDIPLFYDTFQFWVSDLKPGATYYLRPFIANDSRQVLLDEISFTTK